METGRKIVKVEILRRIINFLGNYTLAFYLMHYYVMEGLRYIGNVDVRSIVWRLGAPVIIEIIVVVITYVLRKIPVLRKIVP